MGLNYHFYSFGPCTFHWYIKQYEYDLKKPQTMSKEAYEKGILHSFPPENDIRSSFVAHATTPIGPQSDPSGLLTLVHIMVISTTVDMTLKNTI